MLQSICEPWLGPTMSGSKGEVLTLILGHRAWVEDAGGGDSGGKCFQTPQCMQSEPTCALIGMAAGVTLARSRLFRCSWNADGLFSAATGKKEEQSAQEQKQAATRIFSNSILMSAIKIATQTSRSLYCAD